MAPLHAFVSIPHETPGIPGRSFRPVAGVPMYLRIVQTVMRCRMFRSVTVESDSQAVLDELERRCPGVSLRTRPTILRGTQVSTTQALRNALPGLDGECFALIDSGAAMLTSQTIDRACAAFKRDHGMVDSLFGVTRLRGHAWDEQARPLDQERDTAPHEAVEQPIFEEARCLYLIDRQVAVRSGTPIGRRPMMFEIDRDEALLVETERDLRLASWLHADLSERELAA